MLKSSRGEAHGNTIDEKSVGPELSNPDSLSLEVQAMTDLLWSNKIGGSKS